jgi:2,4-dienoyl-CoA reductase-like NADH-dependent reductase (Old Yellow Enzyme family)
MPRCSPAETPKQCLKPGDVNVEAARWPLQLIARFRAKTKRADRPPRGVGPSGLFGGIGNPTTQDGKLALPADQDSIVEAYEKAAINTKMVDFHGVELHAAQGNLLDKSSWPGTNKRQDQ